MLILFQPDKHLEMLSAFLVETRMIGGKEAPASELELTGAAFEIEKGLLPLLYGKFPFLGL